MSEPTASGRSGKRKRRPRRKSKAARSKEAPPKEEEKIVVENEPEQVDLFDFEPKVITDTMFITLATAATTEETTAAKSTVVAEPSSPDSGDSNELFDKEHLASELAEVSSSNRALKERMMSLAWQLSTVEREHSCKQVEIERLHERNDLLHCQIEDLRLMAETREEAHRALESQLCAMQKRMESTTSGTRVEAESNHELEAELLQFRAQLHRTQKAHKALTTELKAKRIALRRERKICIALAILCVALILSHVL